MSAGSTAFVELLVDWLDRCSLPRERGARQFCIEDTDKIWAFLLLTFYKSSVRGTMIFL